LAVTALFAVIDTVQVRAVTLVLVQPVHEENEFTPEVGGAVRVMLVPFTMPVLE